MRVPRTYRTPAQPFTARQVFHTGFLCTHLHRGQQLGGALPKCDEPRQQLVRLIGPALLGLLVRPRKLNRFLGLRHLAKQVGLRVATR